MYTNPKNALQIPTRLQLLIEEYDEFFNGVGKLTDGQVQLHISPAVKPVQPTCRVPFAIRYLAGKAKELKRIKDLAKQQIKETCGSQE